MTTSSTAEFNVSDVLSKSVSVFSFSDVCESTKKRRGVYPVAVATDAADATSPETLPCTGENGVVTADALLTKRVALEISVWDGSSYLMACAKLAINACFTLVTEGRLTKEDANRIINTAEGGDKTLLATAASMAGTHPAWFVERACKRLKLREYSEAPLQDLATLSVLELVDPAPKRCSKANSGRACLQCGTVETPQWRMGPRGPSTLCNACGVRHLKAQRRANAV